MQILALSALAGNYFGAVLGSCKVGPLKNGLSKCSMLNLMAVSLPPVNLLEKRNNHEAKSSRGTITAEMKIKQ